MTSKNLTALDDLAQCINEEQIGERRGRPSKKVEKVPQLEPGAKTRALAADRAGFGNDRTYRQAKEIVEAAEVDPGKYGGAGRAAPGYATMTHQELLVLDVAAWAEDNCHLYLWTTNNFMTRAGALEAVERAAAVV